MGFPESPRVVYEKNPLQEVSCQLSFPPVLRISSEPPVQYQELIRNEYPLFREIPRAELPPDIPPELSKLLSESGPFGSTDVSYEFNSASEEWSIDLAKDSLSLTSFNYKNWGDFKDHLREPFDAIVDVYSPAFFTGVKLSYSNVIRRSEVGLEEEEWSELLQPYVAGELSSDISEHVRGIRSEVVVNLDVVKSRVHIRHGLAQSSESDEVGYVIESNFYTEERTEIDSASRILDFFNEQAGHLFRWSVTNTLHKALAPYSG